MFNASVVSNTVAKPVVTPVLDCETVEHEEYYEIRIPKVIDGLYLEPTAEKLNNKGQTVPPAYLFAKIQFGQVICQTMAKDDKGVETQYTFPSKATNNFNLFYRLR